MHIIQLLQYFSEVLAFLFELPHCIVLRTFMHLRTVFLVASDGWSNIRCEHYRFHRRKSSPYNTLTLCAHMVHSIGPRNSEIFCMRFNVPPLSNANGRWYAPAVVAGECLFY